MGKKHPDVFKWAKQVAITSGGPKTEVKNCPIYNKARHKYQGKDGKDPLSYHIIECPAFKKWNDSQKKDLLRIARSKFSVSTKCSAWNHKTEECLFSQECSQCKGTHIMEMCGANHVFTCTT